MLRRTQHNFWRVNVGGQGLGGSNLIWNMRYNREAFVRTDMQHPKRRPSAWNRMEFDRLGFDTWPKEVGFWNAGDNWELTPEFQWRFYLHCRDKDVWTQGHNEQTVIALMPLVEVKPQEYLSRVEDVFRHHISRYGADHIIYNAVMQAYAFAKQFDKCLAVYTEMDSVGLDPNAQTYVNMMLAVHLCGKPIDIAKSYWKEAVRTRAITPVLREDYEFSMWMQQFERMGSFTAKKGFLSNNEEGAKEVPENMWALWGWDRDERKFLSRRERIQQEIQRQTNSGKFHRGKVVSSYKRTPWYKYKGMFPWDYSGPSRTELLAEERFKKALWNDLPPDPIPEAPYQFCGKAIPI